jgi:excinuclease ABC subunit B
VTPYQPYSKKRREEDLHLEDIPLVVADLEKEMKALAKALEFEKAAEIRDEIQSLRKLAGFVGEGFKTERRPQRTKSFRYLK